MYTYFINGFKSKHAAVQTFLYSLLFLIIVLANHNVTGNTHYQSLALRGLITMEANSEPMVEQ